MKFTKIISGLLALGVIILFIKSYQNFKNLEFPSTQLVMFKSLSFYMSVESFENTFVVADKVVEEEEWPIVILGVQKTRISIKQVAFSTITKI